MSAELGFVYCLICPAMHGLVKVGATIHDPLERVRQLSASTSAALPFVLAYSRYVENPFQVEATLHRLLNDHRVNDSREFFKYPLHKIIEFIEKYEECRMEFDAIEFDYPYSRLFATFPDDGSPRWLTEDEQKKCRELAEKIERRM